MCLFNGVGCPSLLSLTHTDITHAWVLYRATPFPSCFDTAYIHLTVSALHVSSTLRAGLLGTLLVVKPPFVFGGAAGAEPLSPTGVVVTLFSAAFCSVAMISIRHIGKRASPLVLAVWFHGSSTVTGALACASGWPSTPVFPSTTEWALLILISLTSFFGQVSLNYGYQTLPTLRASALYYLMVVWAALLGAVFLVGALYKLRIQLRPIA
jgi:drug/metabolite transporter (DMT)-like permease